MYYMSKENQSTFVSFRFNLRLSLRGYRWENDINVNAKINELLKNNEFDRIQNLLMAGKE